MEQDMLMSNLISKLKKQYSIYQNKQLLKKYLQGKLELSNLNQTPFDFIFKNGSLYVNDVDFVEFLIFLQKRKQFNFIGKDKIKLFELVLYFHKLTQHQDNKILTFYPKFIYFSHSSYDQFELIHPVIIEKKDFISAWNRALKSLDNETKSRFPFISKYIYDYI